MSAAPTPGRPDRRAVLRGGLAAAAALAAGPALAACGGVKAKPLADKKFEAPALLPNPHIPGEIRSRRTGSTTVQTHYPEHPFRSVHGKPGRGGSVSLFQLVWGAPASGDNKWIDELDRRLGVTLNQVLVPSDSFGDKTQTQLASGDLPDIFYINNDVSMAPAVLRSVAQGAFTELSEHLSGKAALKYPNLARIPTYAWKNSSVQGGIYGVPLMTPLINKVRYHRQDWREHLDMDLPKNADEVFRLLTGFTKPGMPNADKGTTWAMVDWCEDFFWTVFRVPNQWRVEKDGSMTRYLETDEFEECLAFQRKLWKAGAYHPGTPTLSVAQQGDLFNTGRVGLYGNGIMSVVQPLGLVDMLTRRFKKAEFTGMIPPAHDGGQGTLPASPGYFGFYGIPSKVGADRKRTEELLRIMDWIAAPFGSEEYRFFNYGIEGRGKGWTYRKGQIVPNPATPPDQAPINYLWSPTNASTYFWNALDRAKQVQQIIDRALPVAVQDPTLGLFSDAAIAGSALLDQMVTDHKIGIITGRERMGPTLRALRRQWRNQGGDRIRAEYESARARVRT